MSQTEVLRDRLNKRIGEIRSDSLDTRRYITPTTADLANTIQKPTKREMHIAG